MEELKEGWRRVKLGEIADIGSSKRIFMADYRESGVPFFRGKEIIQKSKGNNITTELYITEEKYNEIKNKFEVPQKGDILLTSVGTIGVPYLVNNNEPFYFKDGNVTWIKKYRDGVYNKYIYQWIKSPLGQNQINQVTIGSTQKALTIDALKKLEINLPPLETQEKIASILSALDDKIELNNEMNKTLEEMAQTLFKRWFIDFDFPNENGEPYRSSGGKMVDSELGEIPEGWKIGSLEEIVDNFDAKRKPLSKKERDTKEKKYPYYGAAGIIDYVDNYLFNGEYILLGEDGTVITNEGTPILNFINEKFWVSNHAHVIKAKEKFNNDFVHYLLRNTNVSHIVTGAVQPKINQKNLNGLKILIPKIKEISEFGILVSNFTKMLRNNNSEINSLTQIKDTLLPKLMSGEIEV